MLVSSIRHAVLAGVLAPCVLGITRPLAAAPVQLRCNYRATALGIGTAAPTFSWQSDSTAQNWKQTAYQITVSTSERLAGKGRADVWSSGRAAGDRSIDVTYAGPALQPETRYFWTVEVWNIQGKPERSAPAWFETGLADGAPWKAQWIGAPDPTTELKAHLPWIWAAGQHAMTVTPLSRVVLQRQFTLDAAPARASLSVVGRGEFTVLVNGQRTGHKRDWHAFDFEDIGPLLRPGANTIRIEATAPGGRSEWDPDHGTLVAGVSALLRWTDASGVEHKLTTEDGWQAKTGDTADFSAAEVIAPLNDPRFGTVTGIPVQPAALLRTDFTVSKPVVSARLYATAAGSYDFRINGRPVTPNVLMPGFTDFRKRVLYQTYDVTALLQQGANAAGVVLGEGWYVSPMLWDGTHTFPGQPRLEAELHIRYADGTSDVVATSPAWRTASSSIRMSQIYAGEDQDLRLEQPGWDAAGFHAESWQAAAVAPPAPGRVTAQPDDSIHPQTTLKAVSHNALPNGDVIYDLGQNMVGWATLQVQGVPGATVRMRFAERLNADGSVYTENLREAEATDTYTLRGGGTELLAPHFTFHGFRYVQVSGLPSGTPADALTGVVVSSLDFEPSGRLNTSSELLNRMWQIGLWGQRGNFVSVPTDCPQRDERQGWMGDAEVFWRTGAYNFDTAAFSRKFVDDIMDAQQANGAFTDISPDLLSPHPGAPGWGDAGVMVPYTAWLQYGDRTLIANHWDAMVRWMQFIRENNPDLLRRNALGENYADWLAPDPHTSQALVATAYWAILARMMEQMATALGKDAGPWTDLYRGIRVAYQGAFLGPTGIAQGDTQTAELLTLYAGLAPDPRAATGEPSAVADRSRIAAALVANIQAHGGHLTTGFLGTPFLLTTLADTGHADAAYDLLLQTTYPSWGYMLSKGATTWWERWNGDSGDPSMNSYNHYAFGSVVAWIYRSVAGIDVAAPATGFQHLRIAPLYTDRLTFARGSYQSIFGEVESGWTRLPNRRVHLRVRVPANVEADVYVDGPDNAPRHVGSGVWEFDTSTPIATAVALDRRSVGPR